MYEQVEKPKESKSRAVANSVAQKKSKISKGVTFVDNRLKGHASQETITQYRKIIQFGGKDGNFIGDEARFHVHQVGGDEHYKYKNGKRKNYDSGGKVNQGMLKEAIELCKSDRVTYPDAADKLSYDAVIAHLKSLVVTAPAPAAPAVSSSTSSPSSSPKTKPGGSDFNPDDDFM